MLIIHTADADANSITRCIMYIVMYAEVDDQCDKLAVRLRQSTCRGEIFKDKIPERSTIIFGDTYLNFLKTKCRIGRMNSLCQKAARSVQRFRYNTGLWQTDTDTGQQL